ncbi:hypothetical protein GJ496_005497 [Pomphorhynchus laevis]|nr:hypothetical protein GJ496_005497 [Pomphorhynchus laevis]
MSAAVSKKKKRKAYVGNYCSYYGYRNKHGTNDCRVQLLKEEWICDKEVLDIGCNVGLFTIEIANKYKPKMITAIDMDSQLIRKARSHLRRQWSPSSSSNVFFTTGDIMSLYNDKTISTLSTKFDTILAMSITKWIHLNHGDDGILNFFRKCWNILKPYGIFIIEPQSWESYKRRKLLSSVIRKNYSNIKILPDQFPMILTDNIGFKLIASLEPTTQSETSKRGFNRFLFVFCKTTNDDNHDIIT